MNTLRLILSAVFALVLSGCAAHRSETAKPLAPLAEPTDKAASLRRFEYAEYHMGSMFRIVLYAPDELAANAASEAAFFRIKALDDMMTDYNPESELMRLCKAPPMHPVRVSPELFDVLHESQEIAKATDGAFDVTVGPMIQLWRTARKTKILPSPEAIAMAKVTTGYRKMRLDPKKQTVTLTVANMRLDLGGIAKGYAANAALKTLAGRGISRAMAAASGDIALGAPPPGKQGWEIGIASIDHPDKGYTDTAFLSHAGISTSGDTEQHVDIAGKRYSHIVDPKTGLGLEERLGVTIIAPNATLSDSLATAVSVLGVERGLKFLKTRHGTGALIVLVDGEKKRLIESDRFRSLAGSTKTDSQIIFRQPRG
jgi:thiamine biosynthesis lipoprotein